MKILVLTTFEPLESMIKDKTLASNSFWGVVELSEKYDIKIKVVKNVVFNTWMFIHEEFDILYMHNWSPSRFFPLHILKWIRPSLRKKKVICLCHASIYGKSHKPVKWSPLGRFISWTSKGYNKMLFFSPKSMDESIKAGVQKDKCLLIHWGADIQYMTQIKQGERKEVFLSTGKENRDYNTLEMLKEEFDIGSKIEILYNGLSHEDVLKKAAESRGILVIPKREGLNYCTGLTCIVEAFALGKPVVAVRNPYYPFDIEKEGCGFYVDLGSPQQIASALNKIDSHEALYNSMSLQSKRMSEKYNMERYVKELMTVIES